MTNEVDLIRGEAQRREISRLCHLTQSRKLPHIMGSPGGLNSVEWLKKHAPDCLDQNDPQRLDGFPDHICCSVEYPNVWYWREARQREAIFKDWIVMLISPEVIWRPHTRFCYRNAGSQGGALGKEGYEAFASMFAPTVSGARGIAFPRTPYFLPCCPTDGQAEVQVYQRIEAEMILGIAVQSEEQARREHNRLAALGLESPVKWVVCSDMFSDGWRSCVTKGIRPKETILGSIQ